MNSENIVGGNLAWLQDEMPANRARLPQQLINARRWLVWREEPNPDPGKKAIKVPYYVSGVKRHGALDSQDDVARLGTFDNALDALIEGDYTGLAIALGPDGTGNCWQGFDADNVPEQNVDAMLNSLPGYVEVSPSGRGCHAIGYGQPFTSLGSNGTNVEAYAGGRYFTFTGDRGRGMPTCIAAFVNGPVADRHGKRAATASAAGAMQVDDKTISELRSALLHMRSDEYDIWYRMGLALKDLGDVGRGLWLEWSATSTKFDVQEASRKWKRLGTPRDTDYRAVFAEAMRQGWVNPASSAAQLHAAAPAEGNYSFARGRGGEAIVETQYLIDPWLPRATVIGFYGRGEAGKTSFVAQMVAAATRQVSTLWISSEERKDHILKRHEKCLGRMDALGVLETVPTKIDDKTKKTIATSFNIFEHMEGAMLAYQRDPATPIDRPLGVVVLDAVVALVTWEKGTNANDDGGVKKLIAHLVTLAEKYGVTFIMLGHLNKRTGHDHIADAVTGAAAWTNSVRLAFLLQKNLESDDYEGFIRTAKTNTGTHFGATYKTVPRHVLRMRGDGKPDVLCGIDLVTDVVWGEHALREMMATDEESERWLNKREKKAQTVSMLVEVVLNTLRSAPATNRKSVELALPMGEKVSRRHWMEADKILASRGVQIVNLERGQFSYSLVQQPK